MKLSKFAVLAVVAALAAEAFAFGECATDLRHPDAGIATRIWEMCETINARRAERGIGPVSLSRDLHLVAQPHAEEMRYFQNLSHVGGDGSQPWDRVFRSGFNTQRPWAFEVGEVIGLSGDTPFLLVESGSAPKVTATSC